MKLREILIETFPNSNVPEVIDDLKMGDLDEWDSVGNFNLILAVEQKFGFQLDMEQIEKIKSISDIQEVLVNNDLS